METTKKHGSSGRNLDQWWARYKNLCKEEQRLFFSGAECGPAQKDVRRAINKRLKHMEKVLTRALGTLSARERAILRVWYELDCVDGHWDTSFFDVGRKVVRGSSVRCLREDGKHAELMALYDMAVIANEQQ